MADGTRPFFGMNVNDAVQFTGGTVPEGAGNKCIGALTGDEASQVFGGGGGETTSYSSLSNKPSINGITLNGNKTSSDLNLIGTASKGAANGVAELDENCKVPAAQLPSYVDDVLEYSSTSAFPSSGESGKIYVALDTNKTYRWSGSEYVEISESLALGETASTAYAGDKGKANADAIAVLNSGDSVSGSVANTVKNAIDALDVTDSTETNKFVSAVSETNGKVSATKVDLSAKFFTKYYHLQESGSYLRIIVPKGGESGSYTAASKALIVITTSAAETIIINFNSNTIGKPTRLGATGAPKVTGIKFGVNPDNSDQYIIYVKFDAYAHVTVYSNGVTEFRYAGETAWDSLTASAVTILDVVPAIPSANGTYKLRATVSGGVPTLSWVSDT